MLVPVKSSPKRGNQWKIALSNGDYCATEDNLKENKKA
jgi:hypothetical protein